MRQDIVIVGCGQIGSRHLQAVAKLKDSKRILIVERNPASRKLAEQRLFDVLPEVGSTEIEWHTDINGLDRGGDLAIIATGAKGRSNIVEELIDKGCRRFLLEKIVCQSDDEYKKLLKACREKGVKAWINCVRPYFPFYEKVIELMKNDGAITFHAMAGNLGLGCNAIHLLSLLGALVGNNDDLELSGVHLSPELLPNKRRRDLIEFAGSITARTSKQSFASITFHPHNSASIIINAASENWRFIVDESGTVAFLSSKEKGWKWQEHEFKFLYSSSLTAIIADSILTVEKCKLPTLEDCYVPHRELFRIFNEHLNALSDRDSSLCPIT